MESAKNSISGKLHTAAFSVQFIYDILLTAAIVWVFVQNCSLTKEVKVLKSELVELKERQSLCDQIKVSDDQDEDKSVEVLEKREVLNTGSLTLNDIIKQGIRGPPGRDGLPGKDGLPGRDGRDAVNLVSVDKHIQSSVFQAVNKEMEKVEQLVKTVPTVSGATYIRYGRTSCPSKSSLVYKGRLGGSRSADKGGSSQYICLPDDPEYGPAVTPTKYWSTIYGAEYSDRVNSKLLGQNLDSPNHNIPCAVCETDARPNKLMVAAKVRCPDTWTLEYQGYLMSDYSGHSKTEYVCADSQAEVVRGMQGHIPGTFFYHATVDCPSVGSCPPYKSNRELTCVVCSK